MKLGGRFDQLGFLKSLGMLISHGQPAYLAMEATMIIFFSYFWVATIFDEESADRRRSEEIRRLHPGGSPGTGHE